MKKIRKIRSSAEEKSLNSAIFWCCASKNSGLWLSGSRGKGDPDRASSGTIAGVQETMVLMTPPSLPRHWATFHHFSLTKHHHKHNYYSHCGDQFYILQGKGQIFCIRLSNAETELSHVGLAAGRANASLRAYLFDRWANSEPNVTIMLKTDTFSKGKSHQRGHKTGIFIRVESLLSDCLYLRIILEGKGGHERPFTFRHGSFPNTVASCGPQACSTWPCSSPSAGQGGRHGGDGWRCQRQATQMCMARRCRLPKRTHIVPKGFGISQNKKWLHWHISICTALYWCWLF